MHGGRIGLLRLLGQYDLRRRSHLLRCDRRQTSGSIGHRTGHLRILLGLLPLRSLATAIAVAVFLGRDRGCRKQRIAEERLGITAGLQHRRTPRSPLRLSRHIEFGYLDHAYTVAFRGPNKRRLRSLVFNRILL